MSGRRRPRVSRLALALVALLIAVIFVLGPRVMMWLFGVSEAR